MESKTDTSVKGGERWTIQYECRHFTSNQL